jgi:hypothetical protein
MPANPALVRSAMLALVAGPPTLVLVPFLRRTRSAAPDGGVVSAS